LLTITYEITRDLERRTKEMRTKKSIF